MISRESLIENLAGDLEYNPRRAGGYLFVGVLAFGASALAYDRAAYPFEAPVLVLGGISMVVKGTLMFLRRSAGFGTTEKSLLSSSAASVQGGFGVHHSDVQQVAIPERVAQALQDFAIGPLLGAPLLKVFFGLGHDKPRAFLFSGVFLCGAVLYAAGFVLRRVTHPETVLDPNR
jgi:hypothetical protein